MTTGENADTDCRMVSGIDGRQWWPIMGARGWSLGHLDGSGRIQNVADHIERDRDGSWSWWDRKGRQGNQPSRTLAMESVEFWRERDLNPPATPDRGHPNRRTP